MTINARPEPGQQDVVRTPEQEAAVRAAGVWVNHLARTLKTCRLYDANNPTVIRFREELGRALAHTLEEHGELTLELTSDDVLCLGSSLYPARSRDDNLALPFYRDGIHELRLLPGIHPAEVEKFLDAVLQVTGQNAGNDDLVTLLWEAHLDHLEVDYVPAEGDLGNGNLDDTAEDVAPWPTREPEEDAGLEAPEVAPAGEERSEDWTLGDLTVEVEAGFAELEVLAPAEIERFLAEYRSEHEVPLATATIAIASAFLHAGASAEDKAELVRFLPRVLHQSIAAGAWREARHCLALLRKCGRHSEWSVEGFTQELFQPISVAGVVEKLDAQEGPAIAEFVALARDLGEPAVDWLNLALGESQQRRTRRVLAEGIAQLCKDDPERLAPWLSDPRWYVVRNIVHILGWIGGDRTLPLLETAMRHPEPRVRQEVIAALGQANPGQARPLLLGMLPAADPRTFCSVLHQLSVARDPDTAETLMRWVQDADFEQRPLDVRRALYAALASVGGDEIVPHLEQELHKGNWFSRYQEAHRQAVARCLARIGTPSARAVLERGARSKRTPVRKACVDALAGAEA
ncbi:MAG TPA: HEAT repeat domain-containing protein [Terriglobales bacterium]|nr:HEAT repeat domain-containing protein [Terriglobales bacterium]